MGGYLGEGGGREGEGARDKLDGIAVPVFDIVIDIAIAQLQFFR